MAIRHVGRMELPCPEVVGRWRTVAWGNTRQEGCGLQARLEWLPRNQYWVWPLRDTGGGRTRWPFLGPI